MNANSQKPPTALLTVAAISSLATVLAVALHEYLGHALFGTLLGAHLKELGAFYVSFADDPAGTQWQNRVAVAIAGPLVSAMLGFLAWSALRSVPSSNHHLRYFLWFLGATGLFCATGYLLLSGITGVGDLGNIAPAGALYQAHPAWLWRIGETIIGILLYRRVIVAAGRKLDSILGGGAERLPHARQLMLLSYFSGGIVSVLIGLLNPHGAFILIASAAGTSFGGNYGLMAVPKKLDAGTPSPSSEVLSLEQNWYWIVTAFLVTAGYALIFGSTIYLPPR